MLIVIVSVVVSVIASIITTKILATHYFKIVDGYVNDICNKTKEFVDSVKHKTIFEKRVKEYAGK